MMIHILYHDILDNPKRTMQCDILRNTINKIKI